MSAFAALSASWKRPSPPALSPPARSPSLLAGNSSPTKPRPLHLRSGFSRGHAAQHLRSRFAHESRRHHHHGDDPLRARPARSRGPGHCHRSGICRRMDDRAPHEVTLRMLLAHSSGLPALRKAFSARPDSREITASRLHHPARRRSRRSRRIQRHRLHHSRRRRSNAWPTNRSTHFASAKSSAHSA